MTPGRSEWVSVSVAALATLACALPNEAWAHVKWFAGPVDLNVAPRPLRDVVTAGFLFGIVVFATLVSVGAFLDAWIERWRARPPRPPPLLLGAIEAAVIRIATAAYLCCLAAGLANAAWAKPHATAILTPELLLPHDDAVMALQVAAALLVPWRRTAGAVGAIGILVLYGVGIRAYGLFHMVDYLYAPGIAAYLIASDRRFAGRAAMPKLRHRVLVASLGVSLMWTAVEKFLYPQWVELVLRARPAMGFGFPAPFVIPTAGFVEFSLSFYLLFGRSLLRLDALALLAVFLSAIPMFGRVDEVGHIPIVAILLVAVLHGPGVPRRRREGVQIAPAQFGATMGVLYVGTFAALTCAYYGMQRAG